MRYYGLGEPRYYRWVPWPHQARQFTPGQATHQQTEREIEYRKNRFVGKTFWYTKETQLQHKNKDPKAIAWRDYPNNMGTN